MKAIPKVKRPRGLPFTKPDDWRSRWVQVGAGAMLHRVKWINVSRRAWKEWPTAMGSTVCDKADVVSMPGFVSRLSAKRCPKCCKLLGIPNGVGAPYNDPTLFPPEGSPIPRATSDQPDPVKP
jgi:hypothetical protein